MILSKKPNSLTDLKKERGFILCQCRMHGNWSAFRVLVARPDGKRLHERPRCRWENNIKIDLQDLGWGGLDRSGSGYGRLAVACEFGTESSGSIKCGEFID